MEDQIKEYDSTKFVNVGTVEKFTLILKNHSFIKEKGFHHPKDFFRKTIANKGWRALCQPPRPAATMVMREFYANLAAYVVKKVQVRGVLVDFSGRSINEFYQLEPVDDEAYNRIQENPDYPEVLRLLTNDQGEWKINSEGHAVYFKAKNLVYIPNVWHHFITS